MSDSSLVFTESNWNAAQTVTVRGLADNLSDGDQSYTVILKDNVTSDARYRYVDPPDVSLKNLDLTTKGGFYVSEASNDTDENGITSTCIGQHRGTVPHIRARCPRSRPHSARGPWHRRWG